MNSQAIRFFGDDHDSKDLMKHILLHTKDEGSSIRFACPIGKGVVYMQRVRMRISRLRKELRAKGNVIAHFQLRTDVLQSGGEDLVTVTREVSSGNLLAELFEKEYMG